MPPATRKPRMAAAATPPAAAPDVVDELADGVDEVLAGPVFGADAADYAGLTRHPVVLEVQDISSPDGDRVRFGLAAIGEPDGGALISYAAAMRGTDEGRKAGASIRVLTSMLDDTDGVPTQWEPTPGDTDPGTGAVESWRDHAGGTWDTYQAALPPLDEASSRRRFLEVVDQDRYYLPLSTITTLAKYLITKGVAPRPTNTRKRSPRGR